MKIAIFGTGMVGQSVGGALIKRGHDVLFGTRDVTATMSRTATSGIGSGPFAAFAQKQQGVRLATFREAARHGEILINATAGSGSLPALQSADPDTLRGKILIDIANPLDFSRGFPPTLSICNTDSLGEQIQRTFPDLRVVKTLNTVNASVMIQPGLIAGNHTIFVSGNDTFAKQDVVRYLEEWFGWKPGSILDLGDITTSRGTEMYLALWIRLFSTTKNPTVSIAVVAGPPPHS